MEGNGLKEVVGLLDGVVITIKGPLVDVKESISKISGCIEPKEALDRTEEVEQEVLDLVQGISGVEDLVASFCNYVDCMIGPVDGIIGKADRAFECTEEIVEAIHVICRGVGRVTRGVAELCDSSEYTKVGKTMRLEIDEVKRRVNQIDVDKIIDELEGIYRQAAKVRADSRRETAYDDVCGTVDELKNLLSKGPGLIEKDLHRLSSLIEDARFMIGRMERRAEEYRRFMSRVQTVVSEMEDVRRTRFHFACKIADELLQVFAGGPKFVGESLTRIDKLAEDIRDVASEQGSILGDYRACAVELGNLYRKIRGTRDWGKVVESVPRWLPSSLQSGAVLERIRGKDVDLTSDGRILVLHGAGDGGVTELMKVSKGSKRGSENGNE